MSKVPNHIVKASQGLASVASDVLGVDVRYNDTTNEFEFWTDEATFWTVGYWHSDFKFIVQNIIDIVQDIDDVVEKGNIVQDIDDIVEKWNIVEKEN